jgi:hypothetical protein
MQKIVNRNTAANVPMSWQENKGKVSRPNARALHKDSVHDRKAYSPVPSVLADTESAGCTVLTTRRSGTRWKSAVEYERPCAVDVRDSDEALVQLRVVAIANQIIDVRLIIVLIAATHQSLTTQANNRQRLVRASRLLPDHQVDGAAIVIVVRVDPCAIDGSAVVESVGVVVIVWVRAVQPEARHYRHDGERRNYCAGDEALGRAATGPVGL